MSEPNFTASLSTITDGDGFFNGNSRDSVINECEVIIEALPDISQVKFVLASNLSSRSHKSSVWKYFGHFDLYLHGDMKYYRISLICRGSGFDKAKLSESCAFFHHCF
jgi:hypothetical protein